METPTREEMEKLLLQHPVFLVLVGFFLLAPPGKKPPWLGDLPPSGGRRNGAWRGKGSFGKGFGPNRVRHK